MSSKPDSTEIGARSLAPPVTPPRIVSGKADYEEIFEALIA
jgi:hypothetical protein